MKLLLKGLVLILAAVCGSAIAQSYPARPVRMVIGFPPGGGTDIVGRIVAQKLAEGLGQPVLVENRGGASGQIAAELVAKAPPDGYTIMMAHITAISILPTLVPKLPYDAQKDFAPISLVAIGPNVLVVHPLLPVKTVKDLVALAKAKPGQLQYAATGSGTVQHLAAELFKLQAKVDILHVPYKGSGQSIVDVVAGHVHLTFDSVPPVLPHIRSGKLRALAVTSEKRFSILPDIPTVAEEGLPEFDLSTWWGLVAPAAVSKDIIARLQAETIKALRQPDVKEKLAFAGADTVGNTADEFAAFIRAERAKYARIVNDANIKLD